jgi:hypothetical protein
MRDWIIIIFYSVMTIMIIGVIGTETYQCKQSGGIPVRGLLAIECMKGEK